MFGKKTPSLFGGNEGRGRGVVLSFWVKLSLELDSRRNLNCAREERSRGDSEGAVGGCGQCGIPVPARCRCCCAGSEANIPTHTVQVYAVEEVKEFTANLEPGTFVSEPGNVEEFAQAHIHVGKAGPSE